MGVVSCAWGGVGVLRSAPMVDVAYLVDAADRAVRGAGFLGQELAFDVFRRVVREGDAGVAALLGAVVDQAVFADVEVAGAGAASPVIGLAFGDRFLKLVETGVAAAL